jgi:hypothetical protein
MWDFAWRLRGSVPLEGVATDEAVLRRLERLLQKQRKPVTERGPDRLAFDDPLWRDPFGPNWLAMVIYDHGRFWIEHGRAGRRLRYDLRSLHGMVFCLFAAVMFFIVGQAHRGPLHGLMIGGIAFAWLYGMNILLALARVPSAISKAIQSP